MGRVLGNVYCCIAMHLIQEGRLVLPVRRTAETCPVIVMQRFRSALNLNLHFHLLFHDGVDVERSNRTLRFRRVKAPANAEAHRPRFTSSPVYLGVT
jgi:hypothetical protein